MSDAEVETETAEGASDGAGEGADESTDAAGDEFDPERLGELVGQVGEYVDDLKRAILDDEDGGDLVELAQDLWEVLEELEELLETLDFEELPEAIDVEELPEAVDVEALPGALFDEDESAIDLGEVQEAVTLRELWDAVDLTQFVQEKRELEAAMDDVGDTSGESADGTGDGDGTADGDDGMFQNVVETDGLEGDLSASARQAFIEEKILAAVEKFRSALLSTHDGLRKMYEKNQEKLGQSGNQPDSLNPTAASTMPPGPIPDSISTRASTVPSQVKYARADNPRRIYGRRFTERREADDRGSNRGSADADGGGAPAETTSDGADTTGADAAADDAEADASADADETGTDTGTDSDGDDDVPRIEVFEDDV